MLPEVEKHFAWLTSSGPRTNRELLAFTLKRYQMIRCDPILDRSVLTFARKIDAAKLGNEDIGARRRSIEDRMRLQVALGRLFARSTRAEVQPDGEEEQNEPRIEQRSEPDR